MILRRHARQEAFTQVSRGERTRESGIYSAWRQNDSNHAHSVSDADALVALWRSRLAHESSRSRATSVAKREQSRCAAMPQWKWTSSFCRRPAPNSSHAAPAYRNRARSAMLRLHLAPVTQTNRRDQAKQADAIARAASLMKSPEITAATGILHPPNRQTGRHSPTAWVLCTRHGRNKAQAGARLLAAAAGGCAVGA